MSEVLVVAGMLLAARNLGGALGFVAKLPAEGMEEAIEAGKKIIPVGTPVKVTGYGRYRAYLEVDGSKQALGNDYSRDLEMGSFVARYVLSDDPRLRIAKFPAKIRDAINNGQLTTGMTRDQVMMSVGMPVSSENPSLDAKIWRFWRQSDAEFQVVFDKAGRVKEIATDPLTRNLIVLP